MVRCFNPMYVYSQLNSIECIQNMISYPITNLIRNHTWTIILKIAQNNQATRLNIFRLFYFKCIQVI